MNKPYLRFFIVIFFLFWSSFSFAEKQKPYNPFKGISVNDSYKWDLHCLALNIYHESRGEPLVGQLAIGFVVKERVKSKKWKESDICSVVYSYKQWSWTRDKNPDYVLNLTAYKKAMVIAELVIKDKIGNPVPGANHVFSGKKIPWWAKDMKVVRKIANQTFLRG